MTIRDGMNLSDEDWAMIDIEGARLVSGTGAYSCADRLVIAAYEARLPHDDTDDLLTILEAAIEKSPNLRLMSAAEMRAALEEIKRRKSTLVKEPADGKLPKASIDFVPHSFVNLNPWDHLEEDRLWLLTPDEFAKVPVGDTLVSIDRTIKVKGRDDIDLDTRYGYIAWGYRTSQMVIGA